MRAIPVSMVKPGMRLGRTIFVDGQPYLRRGAEIRASYLVHLERQGITSLYILDDIEEVQDLDEALGEETRTRAFQAVKEAMTQARTGAALNPDAIFGAASRIIDDILQQRDVLVHLTDIRALNDYTFAHSVSVCALSVVLGVHRGLSPGELRDLAVGALLHDIGKVRISEEIWNKPGPLTPDEFELVKRHPTYGFEILRRHPEFSVLSAHIAYQHHERENGSGYPRGLSGDEIHTFARITAVTDVYDALTSQQRPYHQPHSPIEAAEFLASGRGELFDAATVNTFLRRIALYPPGSWVRLTNGEVGVVVEVRKDAPALPRVKMIERPTQEVIDLALAPQLKVAEVLSDDPRQDLKRNRRLRLPQWLPQILAPRASSGAGRR
ncbi:MAG TPA: HD-GYP domain-containing protein [Limnochordia bacterium]